MQLTLIEKREETKNALTFVFKPEIPLIWKPGQYLIYSLNHKKADLRGKMRFFTISSSPFEKNPSITTRIDKKNGSSFKHALNNLELGDKIEAKGPDGDFTLDDVNKTHIFIAGGIGITPFRSIIKQLNNDGDPINITLLYSNKTKNETVFKNGLEEIAKNHPEFKIHYFFSPQRIDESSLKKTVKDFKNSIFYVSGPDPMVETLVKILENLGVPKEHIKEDYFSGYKKI